LAKKGGWRSWQKSKQIATKPNDPLSHSGSQTTPPEQSHTPASTKIYKNDPTNQQQQAPSKKENKNNIATKKQKKGQTIEQTNATGEFRFVEKESRPNRLGGKKKMGKKPIKNHAEARAPTKTLKTRKTKGDGKKLERLQTKRGRRGKQAKGKG